MTNFLKTTLLVFGLTLSLVGGCSDRGTNSSGILTTTGQIAVVDHVFFYEFLTQINNEYQQLFIRVYLPQVAIPAMQGGAPAKPVPLLVLLAPQGGNNKYFFNHGLKQLANEMIASGEIEPMAIACIPSDKVFGGYFYAGHYPGAGNYDTLIGGTLLEHLYNVMPMLINDPQKRGIGGVGQGAYGAFRAALMHPGTFRSISVTDGPLDFDGATGSGGFVSLFDDALNEQGLLGVTGAFHKFDSTSELARMFCGGASAFSPHDTSTVNSIVRSGYSTFKITVVSRMSLADSTTLVDSVVTGGEESYNFDFHMPFDSAGAPYAPIWDMWLANNLENLMTGDELAGVNIWLGTTADSPWGFHEQTASWINTLKSRGVPVEVKQFYGYDASQSTTADGYLYEIMRAMLKHHSDSFKD